MKYCSTRGGVADLSFKDVLFAGYAKDEGLYMPEVIPILSPGELHRLAGSSYPQLVYEVSRKFITNDEIPSDDLKKLIEASLSKFSSPAVVEIKHLNGGLNIAELFHGPTLAFKDLALSVVANLINYFLKKSKKHITVLVGTSGDTGSAALVSMRGASQSDIVVLLPYGYCTPTQELQMTTIIDHNVYIYRVEGNSDELDAPIKRCFNDSAFVSRHGLISINSINWGRILVQVAHYYYCYYQLCGEVGKPVELVVPTGAAGNITAGSIAQKMGLPIRLVAAVNTNDIMARTLSCGDLSIKGHVVQSLAPAMDIQVGYNIERLLYLFSDGSAEQVKSIMEAFQKDSQVKVPDNIMNSLKKTIPETYVVSDDAIKETMRRAYDENNYVLCPHTATAVAFHYHRAPGVPQGCIATAAPDKFAEAVAAADIPVQMDRLNYLHSLPTSSMWMKQGEDWDAILRAKIEEITAKRESKIEA